MVVNGSICFESQSASIMEVHLLKVCHADLRFLQTIYANTYLSERRMSYPPDDLGVSKSWANFHFWEKDYAF